VIQAFDWAAFIAAVLLNSLKQKCASAGLTVSTRAATPAAVITNSLRSARLRIVDEKNGFM
jgi:hypothetical protein